MAYRHFRLLFSRLLVVGLMLGSAFPKRVEAANVWEFWHDISVGSSTGQSVQLNCGWHGTCGTSPTSGQALVWDETNSFAYWAGAGKWNGPGGQAGAQMIAQNAFGYGGSVCNTVIVTMLNYYNDDYLATEIYTHVYRGTMFEAPVFFDSTSDGYPTRRAIGNIATEVAPCWPTYWSGTHVHQRGVDWTARNSGGFPTYTTCENPTDSGCNNLRTNQQWMHYKSWTY